MCKWLEMPWGTIRAYHFFVNMGSVIGGIGLLLSIYFLVKSKKNTILIFLSMFAVMYLGTFPAKAVRGMTHGNYENIWELLQLFVNYHGSHFIGRVLCCILLYPVCLRFLFRQQKELWAAVMDRFCLFLTFQHIFNRIACLCNGCCMGKFYNGIFAMQYSGKEGSGPGYSYPVYPAQMFEIVGMVLLFTVLYIFYKKGKSITEGFEIGFGVVIFLSEFMMDVSGTIQIAGLTIVQYAAVLLIIIGIVTCMKRVNHTKEVVNIK